MGENIKCSECGSSYDKMFLLGKQGNTDICPMCGADMMAGEEHPDWITWYYYGFKDDNSSQLLHDKPIDLEKRGDVYYLIKEFQAPPRDENGNCDAAKKELKKYVPDAFTESKSVPKVQCPYCFSTEISMVPKKFSLLTGFATNGYNRVCIRCQRKF